MDAVDGPGLAGLPAHPQRLRPGLTAALQFAARCSSSAPSAAWSPTASTSARCCSPRRPPSRCRPPCSWLLVASGVVRLWMVWALALVYGFINVVDNPSRQSFAIEMVGPDDLANAVGLNSVIVNSSRIVGPAIAGLLIATVGHLVGLPGERRLVRRGDRRAATRCGPPSCTAGRRWPAPRARCAPGCATPGTPGSCACRCS